MNDPNGCIFFEGKYHVFYQYNPYSPKWGPMHWGHAISSDLVHWEHLPIALAPSEEYDDHPEGGCFSGSAVNDHGRLTLIYTGTSNHGQGFEQRQCIATSENGVTFHKYEGNPVISAPPPGGSADFRDPKVWRHGDFWYMVLGNSSNGLGRALLYRSFDLYSWEYFSVLAESRGEFGTMWECPDVFCIKGKHVLMFSPMNVHDRKTIYLVGDLDYKTGKLNYTTIGEVDWGFDAYAPQSMVDGKGRVLLFAWANAWPWMPWFKDHGPTFKDKWCGAMTLPRTVDLGADGLLCFSPPRELKALRTDRKNYGSIFIEEDSAFSIHAGDGISAEIDVVLDLRKSTCREFVLSVRIGNGEHTDIIINIRDSSITIDRNAADGWSQGICHATLRSVDKSTFSLRVYLDTSSVEVYTDDGKTVLSSNIYPRPESQGLVLTPHGGSLVVKRLETYGIKGIW